MTINIDKEVEQILELGLKGVKLHPDFQKWKRCDGIFHKFSGV